MEFGEAINSVTERLRESASVKSVYGEPVKTNGKTIIPVARVMYGFGGGYGTSGSDEGDDEEPHEESEGAGTGGGVMATPVGVLEITDGETRFIRFGLMRKLLLAALVALLVGYLVGKIR